MLINRDTVLSLPQSSSLLVPYREEHVQKYHHWMQDQALLEATASERLTLQEEYENMSSWRSDPKKLTFIVLDKTRSNDMAGDVNLHILDAEMEGFEDSNGCVVAELEVMVAEVESRRKQIASDALRMMMAYARVQLHVNIFIVKILDSNLASVKLFHRLEFREYRRIAAFKEVHMKLQVTKDLDSKLEKVRAAWIESSYDSQYKVSPEKCTLSSNPIQAK